MSPKQSLELERLHEAKQVLSPSHHITRISLAQRVQTLALAIFLACCCFTVTNALSSHEPLSIEDRVDRILSRTPLIGRTPR